MATKRLIINADDFGLSSSVNEAVAHAAEKGVLTSATVMVNMPGFNEAIDIAKSNPKLGVGIHLNILRGTPVLDQFEVDKLIDSDGKFKRKASNLFLNSFIGTLPLDQIEAELTAQVQMFLKSGLSPTHIDSERHMHMLISPLWKIVARIASNFGIPAVRVVKENTSLIKELKYSAKQKMKAVLVNRFSKGFGTAAAQYNLKHTDHFFGVAATGRMTEDLYEKLFPVLPAGTTEIMCHPATRADASLDANEKSWLDEQRVAEYRALVSEKTISALKGSGVKLISYREI